MHREPNRIRAGARDAMAHAARDDQPVAFGHVDDLTVGKFQSGRTAQNDDPFIAGLIVPEPLGTAVRVRNDPLDPDGTIFAESQKLLRVRDFSGIGEQVIGAAGHRLITGGRF